jgi:hypothetical protein
MNSAEKIQEVAHIAGCDLPTAEKYLIWHDWSVTDAVYAYRSDKAQAKARAA